MDIEGTHPRSCLLVVEVCAPCDVWARGDRTNFIKSVLLSSPRGVVLLQAPDVHRLCSKTNPPAGNRPVGRAENNERARRRERPTFYFIADEVEDEVGHCTPAR